MLQFKKTVNLIQTDMNELPMIFEIQEFPEKKLKRNFSKKISENFHEWKIFYYLLGLNGASTIDLIVSLNVPTHI